VAHTLLEVLVQPGAKHVALTILGQTKIKVAIRARAIEGQANKAVLELLTDRLKIRSSAITMVRGQQSREKVFRIEGLEPPEAMKLLRETSK
jgi:hypothetical protein